MFLPGLDLAGHGVATRSELYRFTAFQLLDIWGGPAHGMGSIDVKFSEIMVCKLPDARFLNYADAQAVTTMVRNVFRHQLGVVPSQIGVALTFSEAVLAPSMKEKADLIRKAAGIAGGVAGIGMIITGIGLALGWGAGVIAAVKAFFLGGCLIVESN